MRSFIIFSVLMLYVFSAQVISVEAQVVNKVVAVVNSEVITQQDIDQLLAILYAQYANAYKGDELLEKMEELKKEILEKVIEDKLILSRAKELGIKVSEEEINERLEYVKKGFASDGAFYNTLRDQGITVADLKNRYIDQIMMKKVVDFEIRSKVSVLPSEITEYYESHRSELKQNEKYKVRHILIKAQGNVDFELAKVEIEDIYNKLKNGDDFSELAKTYSQGPNREKGGDMGYKAKGEMLNELDKVIFSLKPGEFSNPVRSKLGYHIFKVEDITYSGYLSLDQTHEDIKGVLFQEKIKKKLHEWMDGLRSKAYISIK